MAYQIVKEGKDKDAIVFSGFERGIAVSPHQGIANLQGVNIDTEVGEVMCSYSRVQQSQAVASAGTLTWVDNQTLSYSAGTPASVAILPGSWINITGSSIGNCADGTYFVWLVSGNFIRISATYTVSGSTILNTMTAGTATWNTSGWTIGLAVQGATERYVDTSGVTQYRYYILDSNGRLYVKDTALASLWEWALPYNGSVTTYNGYSSTVGGMAVYNGWVFIFAGNRVLCVSTSRLGVAPVPFPDSAITNSLLGSPTTANPHFALTSHQDILYYTDGCYVGSIAADIQVDPTSISSGVSLAPIQSYCSWASTNGAPTVGTISAVLNGSLPTNDPTVTTPTRIPVFIFPAFGGTKPTAITLGTKYYLQYLSGSGYGKFQVYAAPTGGAALDIYAGSVGQQYFNTLYPIATAGLDTIVFTPERVQLPASEIATCLSELGNTIVIGTQSNYLYPWNQLDNNPSDALPMPESYTSSMVTVNNVIYIFAGFRGNVYITNASSVSLAMTVPDYCTGLIEPYFVWGGSMFLRGRVYFSIQDQTASHTGNCGGIWSFIPSNNYYVGQDVGIALRMENTSSYGTYNGRSAVLIGAADQQARSPQYWSAWISDIVTPKYGIDFTGTVPSQSAILETDIVPTGTLLDKRSFSQIEYKLAAPLDSSERVYVSWRTDLSSAWTSVGTVKAETNTDISGYFTVNFERTQWVQLQATLTPNGQSSSSFVRLRELRLR